MAIYACSDFHGHYDIYEKIKNYLKPEDKVIFLGDAADRGPNGWKLIKAILADPQWTYIKGNHDVMLYESVLGPDRYDAARLHRYNGGKPTTDAMNQDTMEEIYRVAKELRDCETMYIYINKNANIIKMTHSGYTGLGTDDRIWDRTHYFHYIQPEEECDYIIHGHTPWFYIDEDLGKNTYKTEDQISEATNGAYWYADDHKCCIDRCTIISKQAVLLDLDTFEEQIFTSAE